MSNPKLTAELLDDWQGIARRSALPSGKGTFTMSAEEALALIAAARASLESRGAPPMVSTTLVAEARASARLDESGNGQ